MGNTIVIADRDTLYDLYIVKKLSSLTIAKMYGVYKQVVLHNLIRYGIQRRGSTELKIANKRVIYCDNCGNRIEKTKCKRPHIYKHSFCDRKCMFEWWSRNYSGTDNWNWKGGCGRIFYGPSWYEQRRLTLRRDKKICQVCGSKDVIDVHHLIPFKMFKYDRGYNNNDIDANNLDNLISMCKRCHGIVRRKEASETIMVASEYILDKAQKMAWSELHSDMQTLAEMTKAIIRNNNR